MIATEVEEVVDSRLLMLMSQEREHRDGGVGVVHLRQLGRNALQVDGHARSRLDTADEGLAHEFRP